MRTEYKVIKIDGFTFWYNLNGVFHREDGPAIEGTNGEKFWYLNGHRHREDGPAVEIDSGYKAWYRNGLFHREDGPAIEGANGENFWYLNGIMLTKSQFEAKVGSLTGTIVVIAGKNYKLNLVE